MPDATRCRCSTTLPAGRDRDEQELALRSSLSVALNSARGYAAPEFEQNLDRVFTLSRATDADRCRCAGCGWPSRALHARRPEGHAGGVGAGARAAASSDPSCRCEAHHAMGGTLAAPWRARGDRDAHFEAALAAYDEAHPQRSALGSDLGVFAHAWYAHALWLLGDEQTRRSRTRTRRIALARRLDHVYSQTLALAYAALLHQMRRDAERVSSARKRPWRCAIGTDSRTTATGPSVADRLGARAEAAGRRRRDYRVGARAARRQSRAGTTSLLSVVARRHLSPAGDRRPPRRFSMQRSRWRSSAATCGGCRRCICRRASSSQPPARDATLRRGARPGRAQHSRGSSSGLLAAAVRNAFANGLRTPALISFSQEEAYEQSHVV